ncbi:MAG: hypothetical protein RRB13_07100 [bacterium]|nr:hypothetical protein [bacterium]
MELHRQTCQLCGSHELRNILVREPGEYDKVFVQCAGCQEMVARYVISPGGYYHAHKGYESYLRGMARSGEAMSGKRIKNEFEQTAEACEQRFVIIKELLKEQHKID